MSIVSVERRTIDETWKPVWGTSSKVRNHASELTVHAVQAGTGFSWTWCSGSSTTASASATTSPSRRPATAYTVTAERTEFALPAAARSWSIAAGNDWNADEQHYRDQPLSDVATAQTPITARPPPDDLPGGARGRPHRLPQHDAEGGAGTARHLLQRPDRPAGRHQGEADGDVLHAVAHPDRRRTPRRPGRVPPDREPQRPVRDLRSTTRRGSSRRATSACGGSSSAGRPPGPPGPKHGATTARIKQYIDLAKRGGRQVRAGRGLEHERRRQLDGPGLPHPAGRLRPARSARATPSENGVGYIAHNETRGYVDYYDQHLEKIFARYEELGIHAIKTGYATKFVLGGVNRSHYDQEAVRHYQRVIDDRGPAPASRSTPTRRSSRPGLARTYPNMMTGEGVAGMEQQNYMGANGNPPAAGHDPAVHPIHGRARRLHARRPERHLGPGQARHPRPDHLGRTARAVPDVLQPAADARGHPGELRRAPRDFAYLKNMPTTWDETRVLDSVIGDYTTTARRNGDTWYLGADHRRERPDPQVPLSFLARGPTWRRSTPTPPRHLDGNPLPVEIRKILVRQSTRSQHVAGRRRRPGGQDPARDRRGPARPRLVRRARAPRSAPPRRVGPDHPAADRERAAHQQRQHRGGVPRPGCSSTVVPSARPGRVRVAGGGARTVELDSAGAEVPDQDFRVAVGAPDRRARQTGPGARRPRPMLDLVRQLRKSGEVTSSAMALLQPATQAETVLRSGDVTGRLRRCRKYAWLSTVCP